MINYFDEFESIFDDNFVDFLEKFDSKNKILKKTKLIEESDNKDKLIVYLLKIKAKYKNTFNNYAISYIKSLNKNDWKECIKIADNYTALDVLLKLVVNKESLNMDINLSDALFEYIDEGQDIEFIEENYQELLKSITGNTLIQHLKRIVKKLCDNVQVKKILKHYKELLINNKNKLLLTKTNYDSLATNTFKDFLDSQDKDGINFIESFIERPKEFKPSKSALEEFKRRIKQAKKDSEDDEVKKVLLNIMKKLRIKEDKENNKEVDKND